MVLRALLKWIKLSFELNVAYWLLLYIMSQNLIIIESGNGFLPDGTKPLTEPILNYHYRCSVAFTEDQFRKSRHELKYVREIKIIYLRCLSYYQGANELMHRGRIRNLLTLYAFNYFEHRYICTYIYIYIYISVFLPHINILALLSNFIPMHELNMLFVNVVQTKRYGNIKHVPNGGHPAAQRYCSHKKWSLVI